ncbi:hypothetical protein AAVH_32097 [Aphelenchoides avenae]|nr:hypothetical protein AAVH_32097 [Aphelenchus avenae]
MIGSRYASPETDYENQKKLLGLCETLYCHFRACIDHNRLPAANQVVLIKNLRPHEDHYKVFAMFYRSCDVIFKRRPPPDLSKELVAYVVFRTAEQARAAAGAVVDTTITVEQLQNYDFFKTQYAWRVEFLRRLIIGEGCRPACMRSKNHWSKTAYKAPAPPPVEQSEVSDAEDEATSYTTEDIISTWSDDDSPAQVEPIEGTGGRGTTAKERDNSGHDRSAAQLAPFPEETAPVACRVEVPHGTITWMLYNALDHRWKPETVRSASEYEYVRWNDEQVIHVCDAICNAYPVVYGRVMAKLRRYDRLYRGNIAAKFERFRGHRVWQRVDMFYSRKGNKILSMPWRFASHVHEIRQAGELLTVIEDLKRLRTHSLPVVTLDTEGCSNGENRGCRLLQMCTPSDAYLIDVWSVGDSLEFRDFMAYLFDENNGLCRFGFHFDATPKRLSGDRKELAVMFDVPNPDDQGVRHQIMRATVHDVRRLVAQTKGLNEGYVEERPRLSHFCLYVLGNYMDKSEQKSCWGVDDLRPSQKKYAIMDAVIPLLIVEECRKLKPAVFEAFRRMPTSATWTGAEDTDEDWWIDLPSRACASYRTANQ